MTIIKGYYVLQYIESEMVEEILNEHNREEDPFDKHHVNNMNKLKGAYAIRLKNLNLEGAYEFFFTKYLVVNLKSYKKYVKKYGGYISTLVSYRPNECYTLFSTEEQAMKFIDEYLDSIVVAAKLLGKPKKLENNASFKLRKPDAAMVRRFLGRRAKSK